MAETIAWRDPDARARAMSELADAKARHLEAKRNKSDVVTAKNDVDAAKKLIRAMCDAMETALTQCVGEAVFLDKSREFLVRRISFNIAELVTGALCDRNRYNVIILGRKSVGKTTLLSTVQSACEHLLPSTVCFVTCDLMESTSLLKGLARLIAVKIGCPVTGPAWDDDGDTPNRVEEVERFAVAHDLRIFVCLDEFQQVYGGTFGKQQSITVLRELMCIIGRQNGRFYTVVTGSSHHLRALAFCHMVQSDAVKEGFIHYDKSFNLNSNKLEPLTIYPIAAADDFLSFMKDYNPSADFLQVYVSAAGLPGHMRDSTARIDCYFATAKDECESKELHAIAALVCEQNRDFGEPADPTEPEQVTAIRRLASVTRFVSVSALSVPARDNSIWYDLADRGIISIRHGQYGSIEVAFSSFVAYHSVRSATESPNLTAIEVAHLIAHNSKEAEIIALRVIAAAYKKWIYGGVHILDGGVSDLPQKAYIQELNCRMFKPQRDKYGSDALVFVLGEGGKVVVHCIQLKLTRSTLSSDDVFQRWNGTSLGMRKSFADNFNIAEERITFAYYLMTTCPDTGEKPGGFNGARLKELCARHGMNVHVFAKAEMQQIWPEQMKGAHILYR